jgi:hypothetical protein
MAYRPYKFLVVPVVQDVNDEGEVTQELQPEQPIIIFGIDGLRKFVDSFEMDLVAQQNGGTRARN